MNPQEADAVLFEAAGFAEDSSEEQTEATAEMEEAEDTTEADNAEEGTEEEATEESTEETSESDDEGSEESEGEAEEESEEESEEVDDFEVELDGEKLTAARIRDLRDKEKNLTALTTKKTQALAEKSKALDAQLDAATHRAEFFAEQLKAPLTRFEQLDWESLKVNHPEQYQANLAQYQQVQAGYKQVQEQLQGFEQAKAEREAAAQQARAQEAVEALQARHSDWSTDLYRKAMDHAVQKLGFPEEAAKAETNPHTISLWINDMRRSEIASKPKPKSVKRTLKAKASKAVDPKAQKAKQMADLRKKARSGDNNAALALEAQMLSDLGVL